MTAFLPGKARSLKQLLSRRACALVVAGLLIATVFNPAGAANHPELVWHTVETEHFRVHYHDGVEQTAQAAARIAEAIYPRITGLYDYEPPGKTDLILIDYDDVANGAAYFFDGKMEIWATNLEFDLRGTTQWLWNVLTHEFVHMVNIQAATRFTENIPAGYFQWFDYEDERRSDVLTGYPNVLVSYPWAGIVIPPWFAEGTSQYMAPDTQHDYWDAHRDMILRSTALGGTMLDYTEMSLFGKTLRSEMVYDHGFGLVKFIGDRYGAESLRDIVKALRNPMRVSVEGAFKKVTGKTARQLYDEWRAELVADSEDKLASLGDDRTEGRPLGTPGNFNLVPAWSPDGKRLAWLSDLGGDFARTTLVVRSVDPADSADAEIKPLAGGVSSSFSWSPDGGLIYFSRRAEKDRFGSVYYDLYQVDVETEKETRLTRGARLRDPAVSPDGSRLAAVRNRDGTNDLVLVDLPAEKEAAIITPITASPFGRQFYKPRWHPDGNRIIVDTFDGAGKWSSEVSRDLVVVDARPGAEPGPLFETGSDERSPCWLPGSESVVFASAAPSAGWRKFDLYRLDTKTGDTEQVSNVLGGAFYPSISPDGETIAYAGFTAHGYKIFLLPLSDALATPATDFSPPRRGDSNVQRATIDWAATDYQNRFARFLIAPRLVVDDGRFKVGAYGSSIDVLDKQSIFGGVAYGERGDFELFMLYENRFLWPTLFAEAFWIRRHENESGAAKIERRRREYDLDLRYDAFEIDAGIRLEKGSVYSPFFYRVLSAAFRHSRNHLNVTMTRLHPVNDLIGSDEFLVLPRFGWDYYRGYDAILSFEQRHAARAVDVEINPAGRDVKFRYTFSKNQLNPSGEQRIDDTGVIRSIYQENNFHQLEAELSERRRLPWGGRHTLDLRLSGGWIDRCVDDFFWFRFGSRPGLRGYTYYSLEGRAYAMGRATWRFPILRDINRRFLPWTFERLYGGVFAEAGVAWRQPIWNKISRERIMDEMVHDLGVELRLDLTNFYIFPSRIHFEAAYPMDRVWLPIGLQQTDEPVDPLSLGNDIKVSGGEVRENLDRTERDWRFYFGILFGY